MMVMKFIPAFPFEGGGNNGMQPDYGMSLRDYFAAKALPIVSQRFDIIFDLDGSHCISPDSFQSIAFDAYALADAMIMARGN